MGANAQTAVPVFTAGQVLTAQQQTEINTGIPVFATTVTRDAAFGGTGEKTLAEGQFAYIEATNTTQYYDGSNWQTVGVTPGLVCVQAETAFTTASTVTADNVFTSSYTNYRMIVRFQGTTGSDLLMQFRAGGVDTATNYNYQSFTSNSTTNTGAVASSQTTIPIAQNSTGVISLVTLEISGPQLAAPTFTQSLNARQSTAYTGPNIAMFFGNQSASTQFDGFKFSGTSGTFTGTYTIYGYSKTV
jgi:hypothetical protein